jgi:hypothetical protein
VPQTSFVLIGAGSTVFTPHTAAAILDDAIATYGGAMDRFSVQGSAA